ncbi:MAG TPA: LCP family protein [Thermoanaerobaculia bacterium]|jgi:LCP family protein required for cell wall assembly|nr:LCP family protein [Thermoanaerobaculia bacterium]
MRLDPEKYRYTPKKPPKKSGFLEILMFGLLGLMLLAGGFALYNHFRPGRALAPNTVDQGLAQDRVNLLVIGIAGDRKINGGNDLADAIMFVSLKPSTKQAALISIPRDLYLPIGNFGVHRLNAAHDIGSKMGYRGDGPGLLMDTVSQVTGQPVHGFVRIDFKAFAKVVDDLGGVDVYVYRPFRDYLFKDQFDQGWQHMNGDRALRYARYRYVHGAEGNNFARELRQQQVVSAVRKKLSNLGPQQALRLAMSSTQVSKYTTTNLSPGQLASLYSKFRDMPPGSLRHVSLAPLTEVFLVTDPNDPGEAVRPRGGNWLSIKQLAANVFSDNKPVVNRDQIQLSDAEPPKPSDVIGDDSLARAKAQAATGNQRPAIRRDAAPAAPKIR